MAKRQTLTKTSVQLPKDMNMQTWPGLTQSEAIRLSLERADYLASLDAEEMDDLFLKYRPILESALAEFDYTDFRAIARALPAIVQGFLAEHRNVDWKDPYDDHRSIEPSEVLERLKVLTPVQRMRILDCAAAHRQYARQAVKKPAGRQRSVPA